MNFFLSIINSINIGDKIPENSIFKEYDKNNNSIWDDTEIKNIQDEVLKFACMDNNPETFTQKEFKKYFKDILSKINDKKEKSTIKDFYKKIQLYGKIQIQTYQQLLQVMSFQSEDLYKVLESNKSFWIQELSEEFIQLSTYDDSEQNSYVLDKNGLVEYIKKEDDEWAEIPFSKEFINAYDENYSNGIKEKIKYRRYDPNDYSKYDIQEMVTSQNGTTIIISKQENGLYLIEEKDSTGNIKYIQKTTYDENTQTNILSRNTISPEGVETKLLSESNVNMKKITFSIIDQNGVILLDKSSTLSKTSNNPEKYLYELSEFNTTQNFEISIIDNSIEIKNIDNGSNHVINLVNYVKKENDIDFFMNILKKIPANQLYLLTEEHLNGLMRGEYKYDGCCFPQKDGKMDIEIGEYDNFQSYLNTFMHEYGHFIYDVSGNNIGNNVELKEIFKAEYENYLKNTTISDRKILEHIINEGCYESENGLSECTADTNAIMNAGVTTSPHQLRLYYLQKYFPKTILKIEKLIFMQTRI
ncbi:MAG: hypothetical protein MJ237_03275 [bacterium]|nr:hypothetical protein [bacterium]